MVESALHMRRLNRLTSVSSYKICGLRLTHAATASMGAARPIMISGLKRRALRAKRTDRPRNKNAFCTGLVPVDFAQRT